MACIPHDPVRDRLAHSFSVLHFDQKQFDPKRPEPLNEHFRAIAYKMHPDRFSPEDRVAAGAAFGKVTEAFHFIMDNLGHLPEPERDEAQPSGASEYNGPAHPTCADLEALARKGEWGEMVDSVAGLAHGDASRDQALSLLEKDYKRVLSSGNRKAIEYLCLNTPLPSIIACALRTADEGFAETVIGIMASRGMWKELKDNVILGRGPKASSISVMEENMDTILRGCGEDIVAFLWENARTAGVREEIIARLASSERPEAVKPLLERMAKRNMRKSLQYCADNILGGNPRLRRYALLLKEIAMADDYAGDRWRSRVHGPPSSLSCS